MGAWSWQFVLEKLRAAGHDARALPFRGVGERAAELSPALDNDVFLADTIATLEKEELEDVVLVGHSFGSLIAGLVTILENTYQPGDWIEMDGTYGEVKANAAMILHRLAAGEMPCDRPWPEAQVATFRDWIEADCPP